MKLVILLSLCTPITWLVAMMMVVAWSHIFKRSREKAEHRSRIVKTGPASPEALGAALMFLSMAYRPNHAFVAKAQIQQQEDADDDDQGGAGHAGKAPAAAVAADPPRRACRQAGVAAGMSLCRTADFGRRAERV